jgi:hypothetical protein
VVKKAGELSAAARKGTRYFLEKTESRDEIIYNDSNSKNQEKLKK